MLTIKIAHKTTHIMRTANVSWQVFTREVKVLIKKDVVRKEQVEGVPSYHLTKKGKLLASAYGTIRGRYNVLRSELIG